MVVLLHYWGFVLDGGTSPNICRGVKQTVQNVTQQDLITAKNEGSMGSEPVTFEVNGI